MSVADRHPFSLLSPDVVLDAVDACGWRTDGRLLVLNSYENRVYQVGLEERGFVVAKFYRPGRWSDEAIFEEHAFTQALAEREIPAVPPLPATGGKTLMLHRGFRVAVFPRKGGRTPELDDPAVLEWIGRYLGRIHALGATATYASRPVLNVHMFGVVPGKFVVESEWLPEDLRDAYAAVLAQALAGIRASYERAGNVRLLRLHGDCHAGNILWTDLGPHFVDFDDSCMGPAVQDLWMLLGGDRGEMTRGLSDLLAGYEDFAEFDARELQLIEALRTLRLIHYAAWLARRWDDLAFPAAFPWFSGRAWWEEHIGSLRDQIPRMEDEWLF